MSGIAGMYGADGRPADPALLKRMTDILAHRGPDGEGQWVRGPVGLGHRLLYTTPESLNEKQPVTDEEGECWLVWDGRLDNREELLAALGTEGRLLGGQTDPELLLSAYCRWGVECLTRIIGEFAFALWDGRTRNLWCARDPIGVKPFYYHWDGYRFLFGSEVKALFGDPAIERRPNESMIADYLLMSFRDPEATFFEGIKQLRPAHSLCLGDRSLRIERYWDVDPSRQVRYASDEDYYEEFRGLFQEAVRCRLRSNSPVGTLLSGGIDSTSVAVMAERLLGGDREAPASAAFTLLVDGFLQEEWDAIQHLAQTYGTEINTIRPEAERGPLTLFECFLDCAETPHPDPFLPMPLLLEPIAARGCRVMLTGMGADELSTPAEDGFLADLLWSMQFGRLAHEAQRMAATYGADVRGIVLSLLWNQLPPRVRRLIKIMLDRQIPRWVKPEFAKRVNLNHSMVPRERRKFPTLCQEETYRALTRPSIPLALNQIDGLTSAFSLECRYPYLDRRLFEFFLSIPPDVKMKAGYRKQFIQRALAGISPGPIREKEDLDYFLPPMDQQICNEWEAKRMERDLFHPQACIFRYVEPSEVEGLKGRYLRGQVPYRKLLWSFVRLEIWLRQWLPEWGSPRGGYL